MKPTFPLVWLFRAPLFACWFVGGATLVFAQPSTPPGQSKPADSAAPVQELKDLRDGMAQAKTLAKGNNVVAAEAALTKLNRAKADTADWHIETAHRLLQTAEGLAREGRPRNVAALASSAVTHLNQAFTQASDATTRAAAKTLSGFVQERYLAAPDDALLSYQAAVQAAPQTSAKASEAGERLQRTQDNLRSKTQDGK